MNLAAVASAGANAVHAAAKTPTEQWGSTIGECKEPAKTKHWLYSIFCTPCAAAYAKSQVDKSNPVFNFFCFYPVGNYSMVRHHYNIMGTPCKDVLYGWFCMPCATRQIYTESEIRGNLQGRYGDNTGSWSAELFQCDCQEFWMAACCPFLVAHDIRVRMHPNTDKCFDCLCTIPFSMYGQVRHTYGINSEWPHATCEDCGLGLFFYPCALNRAQREAAYQLTRAATNQVTNMAQQKVQQVQAAGTAAMGRINAIGKKAQTKVDEKMN